MAFQKVMISGIHTSELTVLKEEEKMALLRAVSYTHLTLPTTSRV